MSSKNQKIFDIALSIFALESQKGHLSWKVTELERHSKVSRTLIYRYYGKSKEEIFENAFKFFIQEFYGFSESPGETDGLKSKVKHARLLMQNHHEAILFYQKWRVSNSKFSEFFIEIEQKFQKKLSKFYPNLSQKEIVLAHAFIHGLVTSPFLSPEEAADGIDRLRSSGIIPA